MKPIERALKQLGDIIEEEKLKESIEEELVMLRSKEGDICAKIYPEGFVTYSLNESNLVVATIHNGTYTPEGIDFYADEQRRWKGEDAHTGELYLPLFLNNGGIWITSHVSRYFADLNREKKDAIFSWDAPEGKKRNVEEFSGLDEMIKSAEAYYDAFYRAVDDLLDESQFLFSGHSMDAEKKGKERGDFCLTYKNESEGRQLKVLLEEQGFRDVRINDPFPYGRGYLIVRADPVVRGNVQFETNKKLYLEEDSVVKSKDFEKVSRRIGEAVGRYLSHTLE